MRAFKRAPKLGALHLRSPQEALHGVLGGALTHMRAIRASMRAQVKCFAPKPPLRSSAWHYIVALSCALRLPLKCKIRCPALELPTTAFMVLWLHGALAFTPSLKPRFSALHSSFQHHILHGVFVVLSCVCASTKPKLGALRGILKWRSHKRLPSM